MMFHFAKLGCAPAGKGQVCAPRSSLFRFVARGQSPLTLSAGLCTSFFLHVKIKRAPAHKSNTLNSKIMTYVRSIFNNSLNSNRKLIYFSVEVITYDGESFTTEVEARTTDEAMMIAAAEFDNVDYTMVQGCFAGW